MITIKKISEIKILIYFILFQQFKKEILQYILLFYN